MILSSAWSLAAHIKAELVPFCDQIEVAGSIRRAREHPNDIDIVVLPKAGQEPALRARIFERTTPVSDGPKNLICRLKDGTQLDVFFTHGPITDLFTSEPTNWGSVLLCRTGSKEHNIRLAQRAQQMGIKWETMRGLVNAEGKVIASKSEEEIFQALNMEFVPPAMREVEP